MLSRSMRPDDWPVPVPLGIPPIHLGSTVPAAPMETATRGREPANLGALIVGPGERSTTDRVTQYITKPYTPALFVRGVMYAVAPFLDVGGSHESVQVFARRLK